MIFVQSLLDLVIILDDCNIQIILNFMYIVYVPLEVVATIKKDFVAFG